MSNIKEGSTKKRGLHHRVSRWHKWRGGQSNSRRVNKAKFSRTDGLPLPHFLANGAPAVPAHGALLILILPQINSIQKMARGKSCFLKLKLGVAHLLS